MKNIERWYIKMSLMYMAGVWLTLSSFRYMRYSERSVLPRDTEIHVPDDMTAVVVESPHCRAIYYYKKGHVPLKDKIQNFLNRYTGSGDK